MKDERYTYLCMDGHVIDVPAWGTYASCQALVPIKPGSAHRAPCGGTVMQILYDPALEAAYLTGGGAAVLAIVRERIRDGIAVHRSVRSSAATNPR